MNLILYKKGSDKISYFIENCIKNGSSYKGSNISLTGMKDSIWCYKWTRQIICPVAKKYGAMVFDENVSDIIEAPKFLGINVSTEQDVDNVIKKEIAKTYSIEDEIKLNRRRDKEFFTYDKFVEKLVSDGKKFKKDNF